MPGPRPDVPGAVLLLLAGLAGLAQLAAPWLTADAAFRVQAPTGWQVYRLLRTTDGASATVMDTVAAYAILAVAAGGLGLVLLAAAVLLPIDHAPLGYAAIAISAIALAAGLWVLVSARSALGTGVSGLFGQAGLGFYLFLAAGVLGIAGALRTLAAG